MLKFKKCSKVISKESKERSDIYTLMNGLQRDIKRFLIKVSFISVTVILCGIYAISYLMR